MHHRSTQLLTDTLDEVASFVDHVGDDCNEAACLKKDRIGWAVVLIVAALILFPSLGATRLWDEDEGFYASTAAEMFERKDWVVPYFNGSLFGHKPPWMYWMMMVGYSVFGVGEFGARCLSAVFGCLGVLLTFQLGKLLFNLRVGLIGAVVLASSVMFTVVGRSATPDGFLVCFTVAALYLFCCELFGAKFEETGRFSWKSMVTIYAILGLGMLTKGPIAVVFPIFIMAATHVLTPLGRQTQKPTSKLMRTLQHPGIRPSTWIKACWKLRPVTGTLALLLIAGPWYLTVGWQTDGEFHREFFGVHHFQRATSSMEGHGGSLIYYPVSILIGMYPWTVATGPVLLIWFHRFRENWQSNFVPSSLHSDSAFSLRAQKRAGIAMQIVSIWALIYLFVFTLAATKLPNYVLPAYPAFALIFAFGFDAWLSSPSSFSTLWPRAALGVLVFVGAIIGMAVPVMAWVPFGSSTALEHLNLAPAVETALVRLGMLGLPALIGGSIALFCLERKKSQLAFLAFCASAIATVACLWNLAAPQLDQLQGPQRLISEIRRNPNLQEAEIATFDFFRPTMVFYSGSAIRKCYTCEQVVSFFSKQPSGILVCDSSRLDELMQSLPANTRVVHRQARFPESGELVALHSESDRVALHPSDGRPWPSDKSAIPVR